MSKVFSIDLILENCHSADAVYQDCLSKCFPNRFELLMSMGVDPFDKFCQNILYPISGKTGVAKFTALIRNSLLIYNKIAAEKNSGVVVFYQALYGSEMVITVLVLLLISVTRLKTKVKLGLILRFELSRVQKLVFPFLFKLIERNHNLSLFTDTVGLQRAHKKLIGLMPILLPIPHTFSFPLKNEISSYLRIGFPGFPRQEKGGLIIKDIIRLINDSQIKFHLQPWKLYLTEFSNLANVDLGFNTESRGDYINYVVSCDLIVLPYDPVKYCVRSSGIFVEAIVAGKIVLVPNSTWMSNELRLMGLSDLIVKDFNNLNEVFEKVLYVSRNRKIILESLRLKTVSFVKYHNQNSFSKIILGNI